MAVTFLTNSASLNAQTNLQKTTLALSKTYERLSSGLRITSASDDAAGLAIADGLRAEEATASQAIRNVNEGISLVSIADGAMQEIASLLTRMGELAEQSANGTITTTQRSSLELEFVALGSEIYRISNSTEFNDISLLRNSSNINIQAGTTSSSSSQISISGVAGTLLAFGLGSSDTAALNFTLNGATSVSAQTNAGLALTAVQSAVAIASLMRGTLGASESRLSVALSNLQTYRENVATAESNIRDADIAFEAAELVKQQILQQGASAVLAQANQQPELLLSLLKR